MEFIHEVHIGNGRILDTDAVMTITQHTLEALYYHYCDKYGHFGAYCDKACPMFLDLNEAAMNPNNVVYTCALAKVRDGLHKDFAGTDKKEE